MKFPLPPPCFSAQGLALFFGTEIKIRLQRDEFSFPEKQNPRSKTKGLICWVSNIACQRWFVWNPTFCHIKSFFFFYVTLAGSLFVWRELSVRRSLFFCLALNVAQMQASNCVVMDRWLVQRFTVHAKWLLAL